MKRLALILLLAAGCSLTSFACDICGCGVGNSYIGILPDFNKRIMGLRYRYNSIFSHVGVGGSNTYLTTEERYRNIELWMGWNITSNFRLMASAPYSINQRINQGATTSKNGIGDISLSGLYQIINTSHGVLNNKLLVQSLWIGAGIKLPTGKYNPIDKSSDNQTANLFQLGTGSVDFLFTAMYDLRLQDAGINLSGTYKINTANRYDYSYGSKISSNAQLYYKFRIREKVTVAPNGGLQFESAAKDLDHDLAVALPFLEAVSARACGFAAEILAAFADGFR